MVGAEIVVGAGVVIEEIMVRTKPVDFQPSLILLPPLRIAEIEQ